MQDIDLDYIEDVLTFTSILGEDREIITPSIIEYVNEHTFMKEGNNLLMNIVKDFYIENTAIPTLSEIKLFIKGDENTKRFIDFIELSKVFIKKLDIDKLVLIRYIEEFLKQRLMMGILKEAHLQDIAGKPIDSAELFAKIEEATGVYLMDDVGLNLFSNPQEYIKQLESTDSRISTGFSWLDEQIGGGLLTSGSVMYNFCAPSNIGKSNFIKSIAGNVAKQNKNVLVVSLEMPRFIYANRFVSELSGLPIKSLTKDVEGVTQFLEGAKDAGFGDILIKDFATGSITPQGLLAFIKRAQKTLGIKFDVICVDYPELLKPSRVYGNRHDLTVAQQYVETRSLSFSLGVPFIVVSQMNRSAYNKECPSMEDIGSAIGIIQCSDFGGFLYSTDEMKSLNLIGLSIGKSRFGPVNRKQNFVIDPRTLSIREADSKYEESPDQIETNYIIETPEPTLDILDDLFGD